MIGHEALLRWQHERRGLLSPAAFIAPGEESGLIEQVDWLLYEQVVAELARGGNGYISVNVSPRHFRSPDFADRLLGLLHAADADPARLRVEITEVALLDDAPRTLRILNTLREHGVLAQLDDFGTGFSALSYLHRFPISGLKIDRSFVSGLDEEGARGKPYLIRAILALAGTPQASRRWAKASRPKPSAAPCWRWAVAAGRASCSGVQRRAWCPESRPACRGRRRGQGTVRVGRLEWHTCNMTPSPAPRRPLRPLPYRAVPPARS